jgi:hypothetical protein
MMTALTKATFLVGLPLGAAWYFRRGYVLIAVALVVAAFALIIGTNFRRDVPRKQAKRIYTNRRRVTAETSPSS